GEQNPPHVTGLKLLDIKTDRRSTLAVHGLFIAIGHNPVTDIFKGQITLDNEGYIVTRPDSTATDVPGVFAAGDVRDKVFRQAVTAAGMGCMAALEAVRFLAEQDHEAMHKPLSHHEAEKILQERLFAHPKIEVIWDSAVDEVTGASDPMGVTGVRLKNVKTGETKDVPCDGVFIAIGHAPASQLFKGQLEMDAAGYLKVKAGSASTAIQGVYAAGDVTDDVYRQAVTAAGMGCMAALEAVRFLAEEDHRKAHHPISHHEAEKIGVW
ncbi:MAG TPA: FAD-dependent oxidoreductase, partial [Caulobacteraceae bacterium]|nr:FAD-dependent oxidoreductase [Caulobacteraceae bacterium]